MRKLLLAFLTVISLAPILSGCYYYPYHYDGYDRGYRYDRRYYEDRRYDGPRDRDRDDDGDHDYRERR